MSTSIDSGGLSAQPTVTADTPDERLTMPAARLRRSAVGEERYHSECADSLQAVPPKHWDRLAGAGSAPLRHAFLTAWEACELRGLRSRPVLTHAASQVEPVAACPGYLYDLDIVTARLPQSAPLMRAARRLRPALLYVRTYELGTPTPLTSPFLVPDRELESLHVPRLIDAGIEEGERRDVSFIFVQNFTSTTGPAGERLAERGFAPVGGPPTAVVVLPYSSFDDYLGAMRAQYRRRAQQTLKRSSSLSVEHRHRFADLADDLARLWRANYERAREVRREILPPAFFRAVSALDETDVLLLRRPDGTIASFALLLADRPWLSFLQCGFESDAGREEGAYFRLLYEIVRFAITSGYEQVDLGITTLAPKLDVGAVPVPLIVWLRHRNPLVQRLIVSFARGPLRPSELDPRRVFKAPPPSATELVARRGLPS